MIYFAQSPDGGPVKIGSSVDVFARVRSLEAHYGQPLAVLATMPGDEAVEREVHQRFAHLRLDRTGRSGVQPEQFRPARELMEFINRPLLAGADPDAVEAMTPVPRPGVRSFAFRVSDDYARWLEAYARHSRTPVAGLIDRVLAERAEADGFEAPPERIP